jgi:hypothetical protein
MYYVTSRTGGPVVAGGKRIPAGQALPMEEIPADLKRYDGSNEKYAHLVTITKEDPFLKKPEPPKTLEPRKPAGGQVPPKQPAPPVNPGGLDTSKQPDPPGNPDSKQPEGEPGGAEGGGETGEGEEGSGEDEAEGEGSGAGATDQPAGEVKKASRRSRGGAK